MLEYQNPTGDPLDNSKWRHEGQVIKGPNWEKKMDEPMYDWGGENT